jgi:hypothetical protein
MRKGSSRPGSARHQQFRARAKTRVDDLQDMFSGLQYARKEARSTDAVVLEEQLHQMLREWFTLSPPIHPLQFFLALLRWCGV